MENKKFNMTITFAVEEITSSGGKPFTTTSTHYHELPREGVAAVERAGIKMLGELRDYGDSQIAQLKKVS